MKKIVIIGGGASGMVAAISAAQTNKDAKVYIFEQKEKLGKKVLATGNGRCNLTNRVMDSSCFRGDHSELIANVLENFNTKDTLEFFSSLGLRTKSRDGYIYPRSDQAQTVVDLLCEVLAKLQVSVLTDTRVDKIKQTDKGFEIISSAGKLFADQLILACGGKADSSLGSDGSGYAFAKTFGHHLTPIVPALVPLKVKEFSFKKASGVRTQATVTAIVDGENVSQDTGELQLTAYGLSGIPIFQISRFISRGLYDKKSVKVAVDFLPEMSTDEFMDWVQECQYSSNNKTLNTFLIGIFNQKLVVEFLKKTHLPGKFMIKDMKDAQWMKLIHNIKQQEFVIEDTMGFDRAQVCAGGVSSIEVNPNTLESKYVRNLYITGELLDVDGICGGYNLQFAWATGYLAGKDAAK